MEPFTSKNLELKLEGILRRKRLSATDSRKKILSLFLSTKDALSHNDIEKKAGEKFDRVTVYRTLQSFVEKGIIHAIPSTEEAVHYALCKDCHEGHHEDQHLHFVCTQCHETICLENSTFPQVTLPEGYIAERVQVVVNGVCRKCGEGERIQNAKVKM
jgi:Fur family transcriptional regulator, ferric uptake regulator